MENKTKIYIAAGVIIILAAGYMFSKRSTNGNNIGSTIQTITSTNATIGHEITTGSNAIDRATEASTLASDYVSGSQEANSAITTGITDSKNIISECIEINRGTEQLLNEIEQGNKTGKSNAKP